AVVLVVILCCFASLVFLGKDTIMQNEVKTFYALCQERHASGGLLGCVFSWLFLKCIGPAATWVLLIVVMIISMVLITEKSFFKGVKNGSEAIYHSAKDRHQERRQQREERAREYEMYQQEAAASGKVLRTDKKVSGVMIDTTLRDENETAKSRDEVHEIVKPEETSASEPFDLKNDHKIRMIEETEFVDDYVDDVIPEKAPKKKPAAKQKAEPKSVTKEQEIVINETQSSSDGYAFPPLKLLEKGKKSTGDSAAHLNETAAKLQETLLNFGVRATVTDISQGPTVTRYELEPDAGVKVSKIVGLSDDIKLRMAATDIRIEAPIPGKAAVGIEIPNANNATVMFRDLIETDAFMNAPSKISFAVGKDLGGEVVVADIAKMPHMLIAGATGSGKSVCINTLIMSILYKARPDEVKLIMIDPKVVELSVYNDIPHLLIPVVTDPKKAAAALQWGVNEMTDRYNKFAELGVRDLKGYNKRVETLLDQDASEEDKAKYAKMPQIVIIVDELADMMMVAPGDVEDSICRLAQLARAAGIHLIIATQRPSVDVITGLIKANMPSRVAFSVSSGVDSRTILDMNGAEKLLGKGDM
ncbi:MAG: DNA translocase FtsK, partial [Lachnospiraceae bacterium]|nr:DNA translocase FtsK [Lachnospiraceae bacterium]